MKMWTAVAVILSVAFGLTMLIVTGATAVLVAVGKITIPGTAEHKVRMAQASQDVVEMERQRLLAIEQIHAMKVADYERQRAIAEQSES